MKSLLFNFVFFFTILGCGNEDCNSLQGKFTSYSQAISKIKNTNFTFTDNVNTSKSSWVRGASYYSCDKKIGYFIINTDNQYYIHKDLPLNVWNSFKNSTSFGSYYNRNIKNNYQLYLTN